MLHGYAFVMLCGTGLWTIRTLATSALVNSDPENFGPSQFGPRPLVNSDPDHWSIRTFFIGQFGPQNEKFFGQFGPFLLVNSDLFHWSLRTFSFGQFGPLHYVFFITKTAFKLKMSRPNIQNETSIRIEAVQSAVSF